MIDFFKKKLINFVGFSSSEISFCEYSHPQLHKVFSLYMKIFFRGTKTFAQLGLMGEKSGLVGICGQTPSYLTT